MKRFVPNFFSNTSLCLW